MINKQHFNICAVQGPSFPQNDPIHPFISQQVMIKCGAFKSYHALVKDVSPSEVIVELQALLIAKSSLRQLISWYDFILV
jgi:hypothetical protein